MSSSAPSPRGGTSGYRDRSSAARLADQGSRDLSATLEAEFDALDADLDALDEIDVRRAPTAAQAYSPARPQMRGTMRPAPLPAPMPAPAPRGLPASLDPRGERRDGGQPTPRLTPTGARPSSRPAARPVSGGFTAMGVALLVGGVTALAAVISGMIWHELGVMFDLVFAAVSIYAAIRVSYRDALAAVIAPPLAFAVAGIVGGRFTDQSSHGSMVMREAAGVFTHLAFGAPWLVCTTAACGLIVWVRSRSAARHADHVAALAEARRANSPRPH